MSQALHLHLKKKQKKKWSRRDDATIGNALSGWTRAHSQWRKYCSSSTVVRGGGGKSNIDSNSNNATCKYPFPSLLNKSEMVFQRGRLKSLER
jgi:hypothetical protein